MKKLIFVLLVLVLAISLVACDAPITPTTPGKNDPANDATSGSDIADITLSFDIFNTDSYKDYLTTESVVLKTSVADTYIYSYDDSGEVVYDANGIKIVSKGITTDGVFGTGFIFILKTTWKAHLRYSLIRFASTAL